ncbi:unnamed protein product, partial [Laminaria digitata]
ISTSRITFLSTGPFKSIVDKHGGQKFGVPYISFSLIAGSRQFLHASTAYCSTYDQPRPSISIVRQSVPPEHTEHSSACAPTDPFRAFAASAISRGPAYRIRHE